MNDTIHSSTPVQADLPSQVEIRQMIADFQPASDLPIDKIRSIAESMLAQSVQASSTDTVLIWFDPSGLPIVKALVELCLEQDIPDVRFFMRDLARDVAQFTSESREQVRAHFAVEHALMRQANAVIIIRGPEDPELLAKLPEDIKQLYHFEHSRAHERRVLGGVKWVVANWPTTYEAAIEGIDQPTYLSSWLQSIDQPWDEIKEAQAILIKEYLDPASTMRFVANPHGPEAQRTDLSMSIAGMTWVNSTILRNMPGSEVFSAPVKDSVEGQLFAPGEYLYRGARIADIRLQIAKGRIVHAQASSNDAGLQEILRSGPGARYFGEVALGTNRGLTKRFFNSLLNEKVAGSFHMAIGHCYGIDSYDGVPVCVNNGNTEEHTSVHWDIAILMHPEHGGGAVYVDDQLIQKDGFFLDPRLEVLNPTA